VQKANKPPLQKGVFSLSLSEVSRERENWDFVSTCDGAKYQEAKHFSFLLICFFFLFCLVCFLFGFWFQSFSERCGSCVNSISLRNPNQKPKTKKNQKPKGKNKSTKGEMRLMTRKTEKFGGTTR